MVVARKSAVSTRGSWFRRDSTLALERRRSARVESAGRSSKNLSVSSKNEPVLPTSVKELGKQQVSNLREQSSATQKSLRVGFLRVPIMPSSGGAPLWLLRFYAFHRYSSVVAFLFVAATLAIYGWTVYSQELWSQSYRRLQNLQRHERLLTTTNATLTNKMAEEAEKPTAGLVSPTPEGTIFLPPAPHSNKPASSTTTRNSQTQQQTSLPMGY